MTGNEAPANTHGQNESSLFARASSSAPADQGLANNEAAEGCEGLPGWRVPGVEVSSLSCRRDGERRGEEKERR